MKQWRECAANIARVRWPTPPLLRGVLVVGKHSKSDDYTIALYAVLRDERRTTDDPDQINIALHNASPVPAVALRSLNGQSLALVRVSGHLWPERRASAGVCLYCCGRRPGGAVVSRLIGLSALPKADRNVRTIDVSRNCGNVCPLPQPFSRACGDRRKSRGREGGRQAGRGRACNCVVAMHFGTLNKRPADGASLERGVKPRWFEGEQSP